MKDIPQHIVQKIEDRVLAFHYTLVSEVLRRSDLSKEQLSDHFKKTSRRFEIIERRTTKNG